MAEVLTTKLKNDTVRLFEEDLQNNEYYIFVSSVSSDELVRISAVNSQYDKNRFLEKTLFGKKIFSTDIKYMIKYYPWQKDQIYTQYDDIVDLEGTNFYAVVGPTNNDSGDYRIYKCLSNNNGRPSTVPPNYNPEVANQIYRTADGYVWKFMYYLTEQEFEAYNASGYIPLSGNFNPNPEADANNATILQGAEVSDIFVENYIDNRGYPHVDSGIIAGPPQNDGTLLLRSDFLNNYNDYYSGMAISIYHPGQNTTRVYEIDTYRWNASTDRGTVRVKGDPQGDGVEINNTFQIVPRILIEGDGTGCVAIPRMVEGRIDTIEVKATGSGYNSITATVVDPLFNFDPDDPDETDVRAVLRPVLSPKGYHNFNLIDEMHCRHILLYGYITETDNNNIGATNTYSHVGLVKNPIFKPDPETANTASPNVFDNRLVVVTDDYQNAIVNDIVTQVNINNETVFKGKIHAVDETSNTIYISEYMGPYPNSSNSDISFDSTLPIINSTGQRIQINTPVANNVIESRYTQRSGTVYFMEDFFPLTRTKTSREEYKLVLEF